MYRRDGNNAVKSLLEFLSDRGPTILECLVQHVYLTVVAMALAIGVAVPLGLVLSRIKRLATPIIATVGVIQTLPSLALVGLMVPLLGAGPKACITALFLYALLPIVRNTYTGIQGVEPSVVEAARGMGMTNIQILFGIEVPLSVPVIMAGIRTSTIICVGIATLGGIVNAGGLGLLIWIGIDRSDDALIYAGALPAMALALILDSMLALAEKTFTPRGLRPATHQKSKSKLLKIAFVLIVLAIAIFAIWSVASEKQGDIVIGGKNFTEQTIIGEIAALLIEGQMDLEVERKFHLATNLPMKLLIAGELDLYLEYTGTGYVDVLGKPYNQQTPDEIYRYVKDNYTRKYDAEWLSPLGFKNTYTLTMRREHAEQLNINSISDLADHKDVLRACFDPALLDRNDGYKGLSDFYGFEFEQSPGQLAIGLMYKACAEGRVDVIDAFSTDGRIAKFDLKILEDDRRFFPPYDAAFVVRNKALQKHPKLQGTLELLARKIDNRTMQELNYKVDVEGQKEKEVARQFLISMGLIEPDEVPVDTTTNNKK